MNASRAPSVLLVEDESEYRVLLAEFLRSEGFDVTEASGGNAAYDLFLARAPDLVITDIQMEHGDGLQLLDKVRALDPRRPVYVMSGNSALAKAHPERPTEVLQKPFDEKALVERLREALRQLAEGAHAAFESGRRDSGSRT